MRNVSSFIHSRIGAATPGRVLCLLLACLSLVLARPAQAQVDNYTFAASQGTFTPITGGTAIPGLNADSFLSTAIPLGFSFTFDGVAFTTARASSNGFLTFSQAQTNSTFVTLAGLSAASRPAVAPLGDDLDGRPSDATASGSYVTTGTAPNRVFTMQWLNWEWRFDSNVTVISFQVKLYEGSNRVEFVYRQEANPTNASASTAGASIGLAGTGSGSGSYLSLSNSTATPTASSTTENTDIIVKPATGQVYAFTPPVPVACPAPRNLAATVSGVSATLTWTVSGGTGPYTVEYGPSGFVPGSGVGSTTVSATGTTATLTGLLANTPYQFYVTQNCGGTNGNSALSPAGSFTTTIPNDDPCSATVLPVNTGCSPTNGSNIGATTTTPNGYTNAGGCGTTTLPFDVWYTFTTPASGVLSTAVRVQATGVAASQLRAFSATTCNGPFTQIGCAATSATVAAPPLDLSNLTPGTTYYVRVSGYATTSTQGNFTICVSQRPSCSDPTGLSVSSITSTSAQLNFTAGSGQQAFVVTATPTAGGTPVTVNGTGSPLTLTGLASGTPYTVVIRGTCSDGTSTVPLSGTFSTLIANDDPCGATILTLANDCLTPTSATTVGATFTTPNGYTNPGCGPSTATAPRDVWFRFTTTAAGAGSTEVTLTTTGITANVIRVFSAATCAGPFTQVACLSSTSSVLTAGELVVSNLTPGTTYFVSIGGYFNTTAQDVFTLCARANSNCPQPVGLAANNVLSNSADLSWAVANPTPSGSFIIEYGLQGFTPGSGAGTTASATTNSTTLTGLQPNTSYCFYVSQACGTLSGTSGRVGPVCFQTALAPASNDEPCNATTLVTNAAPTSATNLGATTTPANGYQNPGCTVASAPKDVWFRFVATGPNATATVVGNPAGQLRAFSASSCNGPFTSIGCQSGNAANTAAAPLTLSGLATGTTYYLSVAGFTSNDTRGPFTIAVASVLSTGKGELPNGSVSVYPNPSHDGTLHLMMRGAGAVTSAQAVLLNTLGQQVLRQAVAVRNGAVDEALSVQGLAKGLYTLRVQVGDHTIIRKVVLD